MAALGRMTTPITILRVEQGTDAAGFAAPRDVVLASVRAYFEQRHGSVRWANRAAFSEATALFRFRVIPGLPVEPLYIIVCGRKRFEVLSVEVIRGMYCDCLVKESVAVGARGISAS
jgi:head-tail adaptor